MGGSTTGIEREKVETLPQMNNATARFEWGKEPHILLHIYSGELRMPVVNISRESFSKPLRRSFRPRGS